MAAVKTSLTELDTNTLKKIMSEIRKAIPVGFSKHKEPQKGILTPKLFFEQSRPETVFLREYDNAEKSIGTLGGGNHFIEIQKGDDGYIWIMIHSGSRNLGLQVAKHYNNLARELNKKLFSSVPDTWELAFLPLESEEAKNYLDEMKYCLDFALENRQLMMERIKAIFPAGTTSKQSINIHHNYAAMEKHFDKNVMVHRKGATSAKAGQLGIIPGSQGTKSYIVKGLGNPESFNSCSHGAGRLMGRKAAQRELVLEDEIKRLDAKGIIHGIRGKKDLDEASGAYKDIDLVMDQQSDLVEIVITLEPLAVIKG